MREFNLENLNEINSENVREVVNFLKGLRKKINSFDENKLAISCLEQSFDECQYWCNYKHSEKMKNNSQQMKECGSVGMIKRVPDGGRDE